MRKVIVIAGVLSLALCQMAFAQDSLFAPAVNYGTGSQPWSVFSADLDGDGDNDLAVANHISNSVSILKNNGNGTFQVAVNYGAGTFPSSVFSADLDGDGDKDLAVANSGSNNVSILKNNGNGTFQAAVNYATVSGPRSVFAIDLDSDGDNDLAVASPDGSGYIAILKNNGNGTFQAFANYAAGQGANSVFAADLDGDGDSDLGVSRQSYNNVSILKNNGNGTFQAAVTYGAGTDPYSIFAVDLDGDGDNDLAVANAGSANVSILKNNGDGTFQSAVNYGAGTFPASVFSVDLDGDGDKDLAVANHSSNNVSILRNNGNGTFQAAVNYGAGSNPHSIFAIDLDGDGDNDLAVANYGSNNVSILINVKVVLTAFHLISPPDEAITDGPTMIWSSSISLNSGLQATYKLFWDEDSTFSSPDSSSQLTDTTFVLSAYVDRSHTYFWRVRAMPDIGNYRYSEETWSFYLNGFPTAPLILSPENGRYADSLTMLSWVKSTDPDSFDVLTYEVQIDEDSLFGSPEIYDTVSNSGLLLDEAIAIRINELNGYASLLPDTRYFWRVRADDNYGLYSNWPDNLHWFIHLHQNHPPNPPTSGFSPTNSEEVISLTPTITWNGASDPDPDDYGDNLFYMARLAKDSLFVGFVLYDSTLPGINQLEHPVPLDDNSLYYYQIKTIDDGGLTSTWSAIQNFWTNHYNYPPEPFPLGIPNNNIRHVALHISFKWGGTVDYDPLASFTYAFQYSSDSLYASNVRTIYGLTDTSLTLLTDTLAALNKRLFWRVLAIDDDSLIRTGGIPEESRKLTIVSPGDVNGDALLAPSDVVYLVSYFKLINPPPVPLLSADANGDCLIMGGDVTYLVRYFKLLGPKPVRKDCP